MGSTLSSDYLSLLLATEPADPTGQPSNLASYTNTTSISLEMPEITDNGGSAILSYNLVMDDGANGDFFTIVGEDEDHLNRTVTVTENISKAYTYRFKYRVRNDVGWSAFSEPAYILAATTPSQPAAPELSSVSSTSIALTFSSPTDNGGDVVSAYELYMATGSGSHSQVSTYTDNSLAHTMTVTDDSLVAGTYYRFKFRA